MRILLHCHGLGVLATAVTPAVDVATPLLCDIRAVLRAVPGHEAQARAAATGPFSTPRT